MSDKGRHLWATVMSNGSFYDTGPLSCLSVTFVYSGQTVGWSRMPLGTKVGLDPGHIVLDGDPAPPRKRAQLPPLFGPLWSGTVAHLSNCWALVIGSTATFTCYIHSTAEYTGSTKRVFLPVGLLLLLRQTANMLSLLKGRLLVLCEDMLQWLRWIFTGQNGHVSLRHRSQGKLRILQAYSFPSVYSL